MIKTDPNKRPPRSDVQAQNIPEELKVLDRWVLWSWTLRNQKWQKPPRQITGSMASSNDVETWVSFDQAYAAYKNSDQFDGVGIVLPENVVGVDLDNARNPTTGDLTEDAEMYMAMTNSYTEVSPSGEGLKSICYGKLNQDLRAVCHERGLELYAGGTTNRYFTITGNLLDQKHSLIQGERNTLYSLQCMISDPIEEVFRDPEVSITGDVVLAKDYLDHLKPHRCDEYLTWLQVGMALHSVSEDPQLMAMWDQWSSQSSSYSGSDACEAKWQSFNRNRSGRIVTLGYLRKMAEADGYRENQYTTRSVTLGQLFDKQIERNYLIDNMLVENEPMIIGGPSKTLKTTVCQDLVLSLATGTDFLDTFKVKTPTRVMLISGESGEATIQENFRVLADARFPEGYPLEISNLHISFLLPKLDDSFQVDDLIMDMREKAIRVVVIDPLYRSLRCGDHAGNVYAMGETLDLISSKLSASGITPILLHHFKKQGKTHDVSPELEDLSQSGVAEFGRQFLLLKRRVSYEMDGRHDIWFSWGGSAGHQGLKILQADTGTRETSIRWNAALHDPDSILKAEDRLEDERKEREKWQRELRILELIPHDKPKARKDVYEDLGLSPQAFGAAIRPMIQAEFVEDHKQQGLVLSGKGADRKTELSILEMT